MQMIKRLIVLLFQCHGLHHVVASTEAKIKTKHAVFCVTNLNLPLYYFNGRNLLREQNFAVKVNYKLYRIRRSNRVLVS